MKSTPPTALQQRYLAEIQARGKTALSDERPWAMKGGRARDRIFYAMTSNNYGGWYIKPREGEDIQGPFLSRRRAERALAEWDLGNLKHGQLGKGMPFFCG